MLFIVWLILTVVFSSGYCSLEAPVRSVQFRDYYRGRGGGVKKGGEIVSGKWSPGRTLLLKGGFKSGSGSLSPNTALVYGAQTHRGA